MRAATLGVLFLFAQFLISFHHVSDAHSLDKADEGAVVECGVCTVSASVFDLPSETSETFFITGFQTPSITWLENTRLAASIRLQQPRAPPAIS
ncbi:hypothetical protein [Kordiimonas aquimaris]|uniref:hypothetical protein n=1 Tax=Kordiimonas aquimaris TaxID=707591 RepID=UPI0021CF80D4|nr:hypothetical protein [Kordiimonas aquimaris]